MVELAKNWWMLTVRGVLAVLFGLMAIFWPSITLAALLLFFALFMIADGVITIIASFYAAYKQTSWWPLILEGIVYLIIGGAVLSSPGMSTVVLLYFLAAWAIVAGIFRFFGAIALRREIQGEWLLALHGVISFIFGLFLIAYPAAGILTIVILVGLYAIIQGILTIVFSYELRQFYEEQGGGLQQQPA